MIETTEDFAEAIEYERLALDQLFPLLPDDAMGNALDLRQAMQGTGPVNHGMTAVIRMFADNRNLQGAGRFSAIGVLFCREMRALR